MFNLSAAMANEFVAFSEKMIAQVKELGPNPLKMDE
jgi:coenzyme F420-reducing hydrogenase delta subunit